MWVSVLYPPPCSDQTGIKNRPFSASFLLLWCFSHLLNMMWRNKTASYAHLGNTIVAAQGKLHNRQHLAAASFLWYHILFWSGNQCSQIWILLQCTFQSFLYTSLHSHSWFKQRTQFACKWIQKEIPNMTKNVPTTRKQFTEDIKPFVYKTYNISNII